MSTRDGLLPSNFEPLRRRALTAGVVGGALCLVAWFVSPQRFLASYLVGFLFWVGISVGCVAVLMLHRLVGGRWGFVVRAPAEAAAMTVPLMALLFLPIALGLHHLYRWADPSWVAAHASVQAKVKYLNVDFFLARNAGYFILWSLLAFLMARGSRSSEQGQAPYPGQWLQNLSGPGLALYFLTMTFALMDWGMSLEPDWFSTIYGAMLLVGQVLSTLATLIIVAAWLADTEPLPEVATPEGFNELGNLLLAFVMLWAYMSFSQYLISWSGNLTEEIPWYLRRSEGGWRPVAVVLIVFHFFAPFLLLLSRDRKRSAPALAAVAGTILAMRLVDDIWLVLPAFKDLKHPASDPSVLEYWSVVPVMFGMGGFWVAVFLARLKTRPLVPRNDPLLAAVLEEHGA